MRPSPVKPLRETATHQIQRKVRCLFHVETPGRAVPCKVPAPPLFRLRRRNKYRRVCLTRLMSIVYLNADFTSLSALMLSRMGMDIDDALRQYDTVGNTVFAYPRPQRKRWGGIALPKYASRNMDKALREVVSHGSKKVITRRKLADKEMRLTNGSEFACLT
jgi:hypothetical protein